MSQADVGILFELQVARDRFKADLDAMKADFDQWRQQATGAAVEIPVRLRDEASGQLSVLLQSLQAQANAGISIPVNMGGGMGVGGGLGAIAIAEGFGPIGPAPGRMTQMFGPAAATATAGMGFAAASGASAPLGTMGMSRAALDANISEVAGAMSARQAMFDAAGMGTTAEAGAAATAAQTGSLMRGLRLMAGIHIAMKGVEAAGGSLSYTLGERDPEIDPGSIAALREEQKRLKEMRGGFYGLTGAGRDFFRWTQKHGLSNELFDTVFPNFDDTKEQRDIEQRIKDETRENRRKIAEDRARTFGESATDFMGIARDEYDAATSPDTLGKKEAEIKRQADRLADAYRKKAEEMEKLANDKSLPVSEQYKYRKLASDLRFEAQVVPEGIATSQTDRLRRDSGLAAAIEQSSITSHIEAAGFSTDALRANLAGDTLGAITASIQGDQGSAQAALMEQYKKGRRRPGGMTQSQFYEEATSIDLMADLRRAQAQMTEANRLSEIADNVTELGIDNAYERARTQTADAARRAVNLRPSQAGEINLTAQAMIARVDREEDRQTRSLHERASVMQMASGAPILGGEWLGRSQFRRGGPNPEEAQALDLQFNLQRQLREHSGSNPHDVQLRESIKEVGAEQARQLLAHTSDPRARTRLIGLIRKNYGMGTPDSDEGVNEGNAGASDLSAAAAALQAVADTLKNVKTLYIVK